MYGRYFLSSLIRVAGRNIGPDTVFGGAAAVAVDRSRNLLVVGGLHREPGRGSVLAVFDRTASGNAKPLRVINGLKTTLSGVGNMRIHPERGLIFVVQQGPGYVGVWHIDDAVDAPPRFTIGGPGGVLQEARGFDLDPKNNAVIVSDKGLNAFSTCRMPDVFQPATQADAR